MNDRVRTAQQETVKDFIATVGRALAGMGGDTDQVCDMFTEKHTRQVAQAVLQLMGRIETIKQETSQRELATMRKESGFTG